MDISIKRVKSSPYKLVLSGKDVIGIFDNSKYIMYENFNKDHQKVALEYLEKDYELK